MPNWSWSSTIDSQCPCHVIQASKHVIQTKNHIIIWRKWDQALGFWKQLFYTCKHKNHRFQNNPFLEHVNVRILSFSITTFNHQYKHGIDKDLNWVKIIHACNGVSRQKIDECSLRSWGNFVLGSLLESYKITRNKQWHQAFWKFLEPMGEGNCQEGYRGVVNNQFLALILGSQPTTIVRKA